MDTMDLKGIAWVGNIYQKFEAMCMEVEEAMCQETAKYVENQVQTVGASMKRFCSDVMQDLLPPSSKDPSKVASADLLLNPYLEFGIYKKPLSSIKEDATDAVCFKAISEDNSNSSDWVDWSAASFDWEISDKDKENCDQMALKVSKKAIECESRGRQEGKMCNLIVDTSFASPTPGTTGFAKPSLRKGKRSRRVSSSNIMRTELTDTCESSALVPQMGSQASFNTSSGQSIDGDVSHKDSSENSGMVSLSQTGSHIGTNTLCGQSAGEEVVLSHTGSSGDRDPGLNEENDIITMQRTESESEFEETCVLVEGNDYHPLNHNEEVRQSYKKKIQRAFYLKKKSARKQEYKQLAAEYGNKPNIIKAKEDISLSKNSKAKKVQTQDLLDSGWELL